MTRVVPAEGRLLEQILDASHDLWSDGLTRSAYARYFAAQLRTPWGERHLRRFALVEGDEVLASAKVYDLTVSLDGRGVRTAGIGAVFTQPAVRGRGHADQLIERLIDRAAAEGCGLSLLFSEIGGGYYERFGFVEVPTFDLTLEIAPPARHGAPAMLVRGGDDRDLPLIAAAGAARAGRFAFHLCRDPQVIQYAIAKKRLLARLGAPGERQVEFVVAEEGAMAVAYAVMSITRDAAGARDLWTIEECGDRDPAGARLGAILQTLVAREPSAPPPLVTAWLPPGFLPPQVAIVERRRSREVMMIRGLRGEVPGLAADEVLYWRGDVF